MSTFRTKIKDFVINKTRAQVKDGTGLFCQIISKGDEVFARLKAADDEAMEKIKENLVTHQVAFEKQKKFAGQSRFVFKFAMDHFKIAKFIGGGGRNIRELKEKSLDHKSKELEELVRGELNENIQMVGK